MFVMKKQTTVWWPVTVDVPDPKVRGRFVEHEFEAEFLIMDADAAQERQDARAELLKATGPADEVMRDLNAHDFAAWADLVLDWRGVQDEDGEEIPYSDAMLIAAVKQPLTRAAFERAYAEILAGKPRRKN